MPGLRCRWTWDRQVATELPHFDSVKVAHGRCDRQKADRDEGDAGSASCSVDGQRAAAEKVVMQLLELLSQPDNTPGGVSDRFGRLKSWWLQAQKVALTLKSEHFKEERETRLFWTGLDSTFGLQTRVGPAGLVPYRTFKFAEVVVSDASHPNNLGIEEIIVGPANDKHQIAAVDALLASHKMRLTITKSKIPYTAS
jgi:hypothetical protein